MDEKLTSKNTEIKDFTTNINENEYKNLITRLKEISSTIALLEKKYLDKF
jgi:hypothetical protein